MTSEVRLRLERAVHARRRLEVAPPDFVGVGVQKAGTSWWFALIAKHPRVFMPSYMPKEVHFFDALSAITPAEFDPAAYHRHFARPPGMLAGEWTPGYVRDPWSLPLLAAAAPEARILVLLRDPVDRYLSGVAHGRHHGDDPERVEANAFTRGLYADQLERLLAHYPREQTLVLQYEQVCLDAAFALRRTYRFLGLDEGFVPRKLGQRVHETTWARVEADATERAELVARYRPQLARLAVLLPDFDFSLWPSARAS